ncbi:MAG TPA: 6-phosphogluconolactonase [Caulobacteraceae bacterium]|nr:6-phosphogluconolactonase [Caulobacteraceae bacterium]
MSDTAASPPERRFSNADEMNDALASEIAARLKARIASDGRASLVATGGTTPGPLYDRLCRADLPWDRVQVTLTDERWAATDDAASNEALVRSRLLTGPAAAATMVGLKTSDPAPPAAVGTVDARLAAMPRPFEVTVLGMGDNGHIASLFPHAPELAVAQSGEGFVCAVVQESAAGASQRLSMTLRALLDTRWIAILIQGREKLETYRRASTAGGITELPVRMVLRQNQAPVELWWAP